MACLEPSLRRLSAAGNTDSSGTVPAGSKWSLNPVPRYDHGAAQDALCPDPKMCTGMTDGQNAVPDLEIVDRVMIPKGLKPGPYVLGWRTPRLLRHAPGTL
eukprot:COSAG02_NODE_15611_length_1156_cov_1.046358_2_plen_101_part_00